MEIGRHVQGCVRARLYYDNLRSVEVPIPHSPSQWDELLTTVHEVHRTAVGGAGSVALDALAAALFAGGVTPSDSRLIAAAEAQ